LQFKFTFGCSDLDHRNWAVDFGGLKPLKKWLEDTFDHKTVIDKNDPMKDDLLLLQTKGLAQIVQLDGVGAEKFAEHAWRYADQLVRNMSDGRCWCESAECAEHGSNSAIYTPYTTQKMSFVDG
jgi:6-pyruvoyltetrahydropterin/6-carboxytetrahydropterin synthase